MGRTVIDDPEHTACVVIRRSCHDLVDQAIKGRDAVLGLATTKDSGMMHIQCGYVGPGAAARILMFNVHGVAGSTSVRGVLAPPRLNAGLLIRGNDELIVFQWLIFPSAGVQVQEASGFVGE